MGDKTVAVGQPCCDRSRSSVLEFIFQLDCLLHTSMFYKMNTQFQNAQELIGAGTSGKYVVHSISKVS